MRVSDIWTAVIGTPDERLLSWLRRVGIDAANYRHNYEPAIARNIALRDFLRTTKPWVLMLDGDQIPNENTRVFDEDQHSIVYCGYPSRNNLGEGHFGDGDFAAGCFRATRRALLDMASALDDINASLRDVPLPLANCIELGWFQRPVRQYGAEDVYCSCDWFNALARRAGHHPLMVGTIGHALNAQEVLLLLPEFTSFASGRKFAEFQSSIEVKR